ncbi:MAG TPA: STAS domain-containing protein [Vicinamibacterales bacterium]|nr:STAS domain-containing protein [Vicinamibacterales bacterium]
MLRITEQRTPDRVVLKLEGRVSGDWVREVDACWRAAVEANSNASILVDLTEVDRVDLAGQGLLARMHRAGARFVTRGCQMRELVREISES